MACDVHHGDCLKILQTFRADTFDAVVTDPPAGISFMGREWDGDKGGRDQWVAWMREVAVECLRVVKPGAHALVWALPRTSHWTATAWEDAGWEVRDRVAHLFGTGFPKSLDVSKAIDKAAGAERAVVGPRPNVHSRGDHKSNEGWRRPWMDDPDAVLRSQSITAPATLDAVKWQGWGTALKPAVADWWLLRKPLSEKTVAANVLAHGCGAINVDACRVRVPCDDKTPFQVGANSSDGSIKTGLHNKPRSGDGHIPARWPANVLHDGSPEVEAAFAAFGERTSGKPVGTRKAAHHFGATETGTPLTGFGDTGTASRFFFSAKASKRDRAGSKHPTVKPLSLMSWLCKLVTPPGGTILDPFAGSGTTLQAAMECGFSSVGIEREREYVADIKRRLKNANPLFAEAAA